MSITHSAIMEEFKIGLQTGYRGIYNHYDGYILNPNQDFIGTGTILLKYYNTPEKVSSLIKLGYLISCLRTLEDCKRSCERYDKTLKDLNIRTEPFYGYTIDDVADNIDHSGYVYVFSNGKWYVDIVSEKMYNRPLEDIVQNTELLIKLHNIRMLD